MIGYESQELIGRHSHEIFHHTKSDGSPCLQEECPIYGKMMEGVTRHTLNEVFWRKDGSCFPVECVVTPIQNEGKVIGAVAIFKDITGRKESEEALRKQAQIIDQIHDSVISTDLEGYVTNWNKGAERLYGYTEKEALGRHFSFLYPEDEQAVLQNLIMTPLMNKGIHEIEIRNKRKTGEDIYVHLSISLLRDKSEKAVGIICYSIDITKRKQAEEEKAKIQAQLLQSQKMEAIGLLAGGVAHDFNNLLTAIQGYTTLAIMKVSDSDPIVRDLNQVKKSAGRAANLTSQLLLFSRKQTIDPVVLDLNKTVSNLLKMLHRLIGEDIAINVDLEPDLWSTLADEGNIEQVIMNLVINARDAMPDGGKITIRTENVSLDQEHSKVMPEARRGHFILLSVEDTGAGMDTETIGRIFEPFFTTKEMGKGTGLGLAVVYGIIKHHHGWIDVCSEPGKGSIFRAYLPASSVRVKDKKEETISWQKIQGKDERILIVEDEKEVRQLMTSALLQNGYSVTEAANAQEAMDTFEQEKGKLNLVISDVVLPDKSGIEIAQQFLCHQPKLRILLISGYTGPKSQLPLIQERGFRFLPKPFSLTELLQSLREILEPDTVDA